MPRKKRRGLRKFFLILLGVLILAGLGTGWYLTRPAHGLLEFDPNAIAAAETRMWQAYYGGDRTALGQELVTLLSEQFGLSTYQSLRVANDLAKATLTFQGLRADYEPQVLPPLVSAYTRLGHATGGGWDPEAAARAELGWWVSRRTPGRDSPESVGRSIAQLYTVLYGQSNPQIVQAGLLRAQAAALRDERGRSAGVADWTEIERLLRESYRILKQGVMR